MSINKLAHIDEGWVGQDASEAVFAGSPVSGETWCPLRVGNYSPIRANWRISETVGFEGARRATGSNSPAGEWTPHTRSTNKRFRL